MAGRARSFQTRSESRTARATRAGEEACRLNQIIIEYSRYLSIMTNKWFGYCGIAACLGKWRPEYKIKNHTPRQECPTFSEPNRKGRPPPLRLRHPPRPAS